MKQKIFFACSLFFSAAMFAAIPVQRPGYGQRLQLEDGRLITCEANSKFQGVVICFKPTESLELNEEVMHLIKDVLEQGETPERKIRLQQILHSWAQFGERVKQGKFDYPGWLASRVDLKDNYSGAEVRMGIDAAANLFTVGRNNGVVTLITGTTLRGPVHISGAEHNPDEVRSVVAPLPQQSAQVMPAIVMAGRQNAISLGGGQITQIDETGRRVMQNLHVPAGHKIYAGGMMTMVDVLDERNATVGGHANLIGQSKAVFTNCTFQKTMKLQAPVATFDGTQVAGSCEFSSLSSAPMIVQLKNGSTLASVVFLGARGQITVHRGCSVGHVVNGEIIGLE